jgi:hypothetical protein
MEHRAGAALTGDETRGPRLVSTLFITPGTSREGRHQHRHGIWKEMGRQAN